MRESWLALDTAECGYCQPEQTMFAIALLMSPPRPGDEDIDETMRATCAGAVSTSASVRLATESLEG